MKIVLSRLCILCNSNLSEDCSVCTLKGRSLSDQTKWLRGALKCYYSNMDRDYRHVSRVNIAISFI